MLRRRSVEVFSLSFLDCICCGFGAIILLLVLTDVGKPDRSSRRAAKNLNGQIDATCSSSSFDLRGETDDAQPRAAGPHRRCSSTRAGAEARGDLSGDLTKIRGEFKASKGDAVGHQHRGDRAGRRRTRR